MEVSASQSVWYTARLQACIVYTDMSRQFDQEGILCVDSTATSEVIGRKQQCSPKTGASPSNSKVLHNVLICVVKPSAEHIQSRTATFYQQSLPVPCSLITQYARKIENDDCIVPCHNDSMTSSLLICFLDDLQSC